MDFKVEKFNLEDNIQLQALVRWDCDRELFHLATPIKDKTKALDYPRPNEVLKKYKNPSFSKGVYVDYDGKKPIGNLSIQIDPPQVMKKVEGTSWLGLIVGEREYWGSGAAKEAMTFFEKESVGLGLYRVELGVFEFNYRAQKFYEKLGYEEIGRLNEFTFYDGRFWADIRMEKYL